MKCWTKMPNTRNSILIVRVTSHSSSLFHTSIPMPLSSLAGIQSNLEWFAIQNQHGFESLLQNPGKSLLPAQFTQNRSGRIGAINVLPKSIISCALT